MQYTVIFDVLHSGFRQASSFTTGLILIAAGIVLVCFRHRIKQPWMRFFPFLYLGFAVLITSSTFLYAYIDYRSLASALQSGRCDVVEGVVTDFDPMPASGHKSESFVVAGHRFSYSDYIVTAGFNNTSSHGGPLGNGVHVRIHHVGNEIARLEVGS